MINQFVNARSYSSQRLGTITWNSFSRSEVRERLLEVMSGGPESLVERGMEKEPPTKAGAGEAVLLGALAKGVNRISKCNLGFGRAVSFRHRHGRFCG